MSLLQKAGSRRLRMKIIAIEKKDNPEPSLISPPYPFVLPPAVCLVRLRFSVYNDKSGACQIELTWNAVFFYLRPDCRSSEERMAQ